MGSLATQDFAWGRAVRKTILTVSTAVVAGTAAAAAAVAWRRRNRSGRPSLGSLRGAKAALPWGEVAQHNQLGNAWVVLQGEVYDVTPFLEDHPGGKLLLLAFAGRDATEPFETVGHSAIARRELRRLHVGTISERPMARRWDKMPPATPMRKATLTGGRRSTGFTSTGKLWEVDNHGFLPSCDPVGVEALNGTAFEVFAGLADLLPALGVTGALRRHLDGSEELQARLRCCGEDGAIDALSEEQLERAFAVVGYTMVAYWRSGTLAYSTGVSGNKEDVFRHTEATASTEPVRLPDFLAAPMLALSERLGRPPMMDYSTTVLYNWVRIDPNGPISPSNIRCALRLTGMVDEEWFFKTHVVIESEAAHAVSAVIGASRTPDDAQLLGHLAELEEALWRVVRACMPIMYERAEDGLPKLSEHVFYQVLRPLISSGTLIFEGGAAESGEGASPPRRLAGPSGAMSSLLPAIDAALGIQMTSEKLREALGSFELSMPREHRNFLAELRSRQSIRSRLLTNRPVAGDPSDQHDALVRAYNRCISRVLDFRWQHWNFVKNFIMKPGNISHAVGSGGTTFDYLQQHITDTEHARLKERSDGFSRIATPSSPDWPPLKLPPVTYHPTLEFWSVDGRRGLLSREPLSDPSGAWARGLPPPFQVALETLWDLATRIPAVCVADGPFFELCDAAQTKLAPLQDERMLLGLPEVGRETLMTTLCHIAAGCIGTRGRKKPPRHIDRPLRAVARSVGRQARLDFTELVLVNWAVTHKPCGGGEERQAALAAEASGDEPQRSPPQLHVYWRFLASPDEEWYRGIHILLHDEAREVVTAIRVAQVAMRDQNDLGVIGSMVKLSVWLNKFCDYFDAYFEQKDSRTEAVMIRRLEPFVAHSSVHDLTWEETACWVYCSGSSALLPSVHAVLGVRMCSCATPEPVLEGGSRSAAEGLASKMHVLLEELRTSMPRLHRAFLEELEKPGASLRQYCFRRFGAKSVSVELLHDLEVAYNDALNALVRFLSRRTHLASRLFPQFASVFSAFHSEVEGSMRRSCLQLLKMRQRVDRCLEK